MIISNPEETAEPGPRVGDLAAELVDHHPFDRANALIVGAIDGSPFDLVAADQISCFAFSHGVSSYNRSLTNGRFTRSMRAVLHATSIHECDPRRDRAVAVPPEKH